MEWLKKAADQGDEQALYGIGLIYDEGDGGKRDVAQAIVWYRKAAEKHDPLALYRLGLYYETGNGVARDFEVARNYFSASAFQANYGPALFRLGLMYEKGEGVPADREQAVEYFRRAAEVGNREAKAELSRLSAKDDNPNPAGTKSGSPVGK